MRVATFDRQGNVFPAFWRVLEQEAGISVVGNARTREQALHQASFCDLLLLITPAATSQDLALVRALHRAFPHLKLLLVCEREDVDTIMRFVEAGVSGYLLSNEPAREQARKLRAASEDKALVSPLVAARLLVHFAELAGRHSKDNGWATIDLGTLTAREEEILRLLAQGLTNREIGQRLYVTVGTVKNHVHQILHKLNVSNRHEAAAVYVAQEEMPSPPLPW